MRYLFFVRLQPAILIVGLVLLISGCQSIRPPHLKRITDDSLQMQHGTYNCVAGQPNGQINPLQTPFSSPHFEKGLFKGSLDIREHHLTGLLFIKKIPGPETEMKDSPIPNTNTRSQTSDPSPAFRVVFSNEFGMTYFDIETGKDHFHVNYCFEPLNKKMLWKLLRNDFRLLFASEEGSKQEILFIQNDSRYLATKRKQGTGKRWDLFTASGNTLLEVRARSNPADQTLITFRNYQDQFPTQITMSNSIIKLKLSLSLLSIN